MKCNCNPRVDGQITWHSGQCAVVQLSPKAKARVQEKIDSVKAARNHAMAHAHETVIG